jgi:hypothetical protein
MAQSAMPVFARGDLKTQSSGTQICQRGICAMSGNRGRKDTMSGWFDRVYRSPAACNQLIRRIGVKGSLAATAGFDSEPSGGGRARTAALSYRRIPLRLAAAATRRLHPYRATARCIDSHGASQHGHSHANETQPDHQNGCQPMHNPFRPPRPCCVDPRPQGKSGLLRVDGLIHERLTSCQAIGSGGTGFAPPHSHEPVRCGNHEH